VLLGLAQRHLLDIGEVVHVHLIVYARACVKITRAQQRG
jgi:hypothetical protein